MAGENNILDDFELDLDIETITLDDIDISVIDDLGETSDSTIMDDSIEGLSMDGIVEETPSSTLNPPTTPEPQENIEPETEQQDDFPLSIENENIGAVETLNIINETPEPAIIEEREIKPVEEIRSEVQDKTFNEENALEEAYIFNADDEIISIDGTELDEVIYGEEDKSDNIGDIQVIDQEETPVESDDVVIDQKEEVLLEVNNILDTTQDSEINKSVELETLDQDNNYELQIETVKSEFNPSDEISTSDEDITFEDDEEEPIALSIEELNDIEVSDETVNPLPDLNTTDNISALESPLNDESDFSPLGDSVHTQSSTSDSADMVEESIDLGEEISLPEVPLDIPSDEVQSDAVADEKITDVEELYTIYNGDNAIKAEAGPDTEMLETSSDEIPDFTASNFSLPVDSESEDMEIIEIDEDELVVPLTDDYVEDDSVLSESFGDMDTDELEMAEIEEISSETVEFEPVQEDLISDESIEYELEESSPNIATTDSELEEDENIPLEEEIAITQNEFIEMANLEESENKGEINADDLDQVAVQEPGLSKEDKIESPELSTLEDDSTTDQLPEFDDSNMVVMDEMETPVMIETEDEEQMEEIEVSQDINIDESITEIESFDNDLQIMDIDEESQIIASAPDATGNDTFDSLPVPDFMDENKEDDQVEISSDEIDDISETVFADENINPEMYDLDNSQEDKEQIITEKVNKLSSDTKDEMKKVLSYLDNLLEDLPEDKIKEFSQSDYYDLYVKILDKLGV